MKKNNIACSALENTLVEATFYFVVTSNEPYVFKFWKGKSHDEDTYLTIEVPVVN